jgi:hypothetical protein
MSFTEEQTPAKKGLGRRDLIKKGAVAGAIIWAVPMIESVPAYASTGSTVSSACSFFVLVYTVNGAGPYADRVSSDGSCGGNSTNNDLKGGWCWTCPTTTNTYDNLGADSNGIRLNGTELPSSGCTSSSGYFNVSGNTITPSSAKNVVIQFAVAHAGSLDSTTGQDPGTPIVGGGFACNDLLGQDKVNVACAPISSASFSCLAP